MMNTIIKISFKRKTPSSQRQGITILHVCVDAGHENPHGTPFI